MLLWDDVVLLPLCGELPLRFVSVPLTLAVFFVCVLDSDLLTEQILAVHRLLGCIRCLERVVRHESVTLGNIVLVADDGRWRHEGSELREGIEKDLLVDLLVQVVDEKLGADIRWLLLVGARFVHADGFLMQPNTVQDFGSIVGALGGIELDESIALMRPRDAVHGHVHIVYGAHLGHELPEVGFADALVEVADIDGRVFVLLPTVRCQNWTSCIVMSQVSLPVLGHGDGRLCFEEGILLSRPLRFRRQCWLE